MSCTDRARVRCVYCGEERDLWGDDEPRGFVPEDPGALRCPACLSWSCRIVELNGVSVE